jgi:branched-chain amino acid transport system substrate-binding protein
MTFPLRLPAPAIGLAFVLLMSIASISSSALAQVKIGFQAPLTGPAATDGASAKTASQMALEKTNAAGGVLGQKIELVTYDDQAKTEEAVFTANKLVGQDGVKFAVSGSYSASGRAAENIIRSQRSWTYRRMYTLLSCALTLTYR